MEKEKKLTVSQAAKAIGTTPVMLRYIISSGQAGEWGKFKKGKKRNTFVINRYAFEQVYGPVQL